jgi:hypothetical protein
MGNEWGKWEEVDRGGERWGEVGGSGERWRELEAGGRWREVESGGEWWREVEVIGGGGKADRWHHVCITICGFLNKPDKHCQDLPRRAPRRHHGGTQKARDVLESTCVF